MDFNEDTKAEMRYKIRSIIHSLGEQADMIDNLRDRLEHCLQDKPDTKKYKSCIVSIDEMTDITKDTHDKMSKLQDLMSEYHDMIHNK